MADLGIRRPGSESKRVLAVVATYLPARELLAVLCEHLRPQVEYILLIDNSAQEQAWLHDFSSENLGVQVLGENRGIGAAQNVGIQWGREQGFDFIVFLDQDSCPAPGMVQALLAGYEALVTRLGPIAAVGPAAYSPSAGTLEPFYTLSGTRFSRWQCQDQQGVCEVAYLHASGTLVPMDAFERIGLLSEELFIDLVDLEWGFRARKHGLSSYGVCAAVLRHQVGATRNLLRLGKKSLTMSVHEPLRGYYQARNLLLLRRSQAVPGLLLLRYFIRRILFRFLAQFFLAGNRRDRLSFFVQGIYHGLQGVSGPYRR